MIVKFYEMQPNVVNRTTLYVEDLYNAKAKNNKDYVKLVLYDGYSEKTINMFGDGQEPLTKEILAERGFVKGAIINCGIILKPKDTGEGYFYNIETNWSINTDPGITKESFAHRAPIIVEDAFDEIINAVKSVDSDPEGEGVFQSISRLTYLVLDENKDAFITSSAAIQMHHNCLGGLVYHTQRMVKLAVEICNVYPSLDKELMVCGTALHDIGKIKCLETHEHGTADYTKRGLLYEHALTGIMMVNKAAEEYKTNRFTAGAGKSFDNEKLYLLLHMISAHHGKLEWGAITTPSIPEAMALHYIDMIDSRMYMFEDAYMVMGQDLLSNDRVYGLENSYVYKSPIWNQNNPNNNQNS